MLNFGTKHNTNPASQLSAEAADFLNQALELAESFGYYLSLRPSYYPGSRQDCDRYCEIVYDDEKFSAPTYCIRLDNSWFEVNLPYFRKDIAPENSFQKVLTALGLNGLENLAKNDADPGIHISYELYSATAKVGMMIQKVD